MISILFVCHGNICRSPMAEFIMKDMVAKRGLEDIYIESAATSREEIGNDIYPSAKRKLHAMGVPFTKRAARQVVPSDYERFDYIVVMDSSNLYNLSRIIPNDPESKIYRLLEFAGRKRDIADPWFTEDFDTAFREISEGCKGLLERIS